jgi:drug/metabolite transporter (DMT)-like permease
MKTLSVILHKIMGYLAGTTIGFALTLIFIKLSSVKVSPIIGNLIFTATAAGVQLAVFLYYKLKGAPLSVTSDGLILSAIGGLFLGIYTVSLFLTFSEIPVSKASPIIYAGAILLASCFGIFLLHEGITWHKLVGFGLLIAGLFFVFNQ